jgi:hypothetical protein
MSLWPVVKLRILASHSLYRTLLIVDVLR